MPDFPAIEGFTFLQFEIDLTSVANWPHLSRLYAQSLEFIRALQAILEADAGQAEPKGRESIWCNDSPQGQP